MSAHGWPFLVARGRRSGYSVLLAPPFLTDEHDHGFLEEVARPAGEAARAATCTSPRGRRLSVAWAEHRVTGADLADGAGDDPHDEHSRPLRLLYGFVCPDTAIGYPSEVDMERSRRHALAAYRRFLADETRFAVEPSTPFALTSAAVPDTRRTVEPARLPPLRHLGPLLLAALVLVITVVTVVAVDPTDPEPPPPTTPTTTVGPTTSTPPQRSPDHPRPPGGQDTGHPGS